MFIIKQFKQFAGLSYFCWKFSSLFTIFLTACTFNQQLTTEKVNSISNHLWIDRQQQLTKLTKFKISGTFIYIYLDNKISANFFWKQYDTINYDLSLINPLGITELRFNVRAGIIKLMDQNGKKYAYNHPAHIIYQLTGIKIPIENLPFWLIGLPTNAVSFILDKNGLLKTVEYKQNHKTWRLSYLAYYQNSQLKLPSCIELTQGKLYIKLKINSWTLNE